MSSLLLVDSPAVAHKLRALVGEGWQVQIAPRALLELPRNRLGVAVREGFALSYQLPFRHQPTLKRLQKAAADAKVLYLALGDELSAWMVLEALKLPHETKVSLVKLETLTAEGWQGALAGARPLDPKAVEAAKALRAADRLVSYLLTPLLHKRLAQPLKIDRLGMVMLSVLVNHEKRLNASGVMIRRRLPQNDQVENSSAKGSKLQDGKRTEHPQKHRGAYDDKYRGENDNDRDVPQRDEHQ